MHAIEDILAVAEASVLEHAYAQTLQGSLRLRKTDIQARQHDLKVLPKGIRNQRTEVKLSLITIRDRKLSINASDV